MIHPFWYYKYFNYVFDRGNAYDDDVNFLETHLNGFRGTIVEVGAGTGQHAARILDRGAEQLLLIDYDPVAVRLLKDRFLNERRVSIFKADGFNFHELQWCDRIFAMYSLVQQTHSYNGVLERIRALVRQVRPGGAVAFEVIDAKKSQSVYPEGIVNRIYEGTDGWMDVFSEYPKGRIVITYSGQIEKKVCKYSVELVSLSHSQIEKILMELGIDVVQTAILDGIGRRLLLGGTLKQDFAIPILHRTQNNRRL